MSDETDLLRRICQGRQFEAALEEAAGGGDAGDRVLASALSDAPRSRQVFVARAMGSSRGPAGAAALRNAIGATGSGSRDLRYAAVMALAKRERAAASPDLLAALSHGDLVAPTLWVLPLWADDRAWDAALRGVGKLLSGRRELPATVDGDWDPLTIPRSAGSST